MARTVAIGVENFLDLRLADSYYVDKTEMLYDLFYRSNNAVTLITRPRRFGKTLNMSMIESFFSNTVDHEDARKAFDGLDIMEHTEFCKEHMNQHPVVFISLKDVEGLSFDSAFGMMKRIISWLCIRIRRDLNCADIDENDREIFERLASARSDKEDIKSSLTVISRILYTVYGQKVILLIDEYDVPLAKAYANGYYKEMLEVIRSLMSTSLKTNPYLEKAVVTGCLRIPKESIFTGVNNFASYSVLDDEFSQYFGFTPEEVDSLLERAGQSSKREETKRWYDGYHFGDSEIYCPWDVICYIADHQHDIDARPKDYWENTSGNDAIREFFDQDDSEVSDYFETLLNGGSITAMVTDSLSYDNAYDSEENLWSLLLMTGYVTTAGRRADMIKVDNRWQVELRIPNQEVTDIFRTAVVDHFNKTVDNGRIRQLFDALWSGDEDTATEIISALLWNTISYMDYGEDYYHAFLTGIFVGRGKYAVRSNKEQGEGRLDVEVRDRINRRAIIIEAKVSKTREGMPDSCTEALSQIRTKGYDKDDSYYGYRRIYRYGIAFYKKEALVKKGDTVEIRI